MRGDGSYGPNPVDPLDTHIARVVNALPVQVRTIRLDAPFTVAQVSVLELLSAKYVFEYGSVATSAVICKLVDKVGPRAQKGEKKVLVRSGTGWQELASFCHELATHGK